MNWYIIVYTFNLFLSSHLNKLESWYQKWKVKINKSKSCHVTFTLKRKKNPQITLNNILIPTSSTTKYVRVHFDTSIIKLTGYTSYS